MDRMNLWHPIFLPTLPPFLPSSRDLLFCPILTTGLWWLLPGQWSPPSDLGARAAIFPNQKFWGLGFNRNWSGAINIRIPPPEAVRWKRVEIGVGSEGSQAGTRGEGGGELPWFISHSVWLSGAEILLLFVVVDCERNHIITLFSPPRVIRLRNGTCTYPDHDLYKLRRGKTTIPTLLLWAAVLSCMRLQTFSII